MSIDNTEIIRLIAEPATLHDGISMLVDTYTEPIYRHVRRMVVIREDCEDIMQEMWIRIFRRIDTFRGGAAELRAWVYSIATNLCITHLKRTRRRAFMRLDAVGRILAEHIGEMAEESAEGIEAKFAKAVLSLPTKQRIVFNLRYYDELSYEEIGRITGSSETTLKTNYHYAQKRIKELMTQ